MRASSSPYPSAGLDPPPRTTSPVPDGCLKVAAECGPEPRPSRGEMNGLLAFTSSSKYDERILGPAIRIRTDTLTESRLASTLGQATVDSSTPRLLRIDELLVVPFNADLPPALEAVNEALHVGRVSQNLEL